MANVTIKDFQVGTKFKFKDSYTIYEVFEIGIHADILRFKEDVQQNSSKILYISQKSPIFQQIVILKHPEIESEEKEKLINQIETMLGLVYSNTYQIFFLGNYSTFDKRMMITFRDNDGVFGADMKLQDIKQITSMLEKLGKIITKENK